MKAINCLKKIRIMDAKIEADIMEIAELEALATKTTSVMGGERVQASSSQQKMADCVVKIVTMKEQLAKEIEEYLGYKADVKGMITEACDADCCRLLCKRYFQDGTWEQIAVEMGFTYQWVSGGLHQKALSQLQKALDERTKEEG